MENWRAVIGYESLYEISDCGQVRRIGAWMDGRANTVKGIRSLKATKSGYRRICLYRDKSKKEFPVHHLVMAAFVGPIPKLHQVNHKNGNRSDNRLENLEYVTPSQNQRHAFDVLGRISHLRGSGSPLSKLKESDVIEIRRLRAAGMILKEIAKKFGVQSPAICEICNRKAWAHI